MTASPGIPATMRAAVLPEVGDIGRIAVREVPVPAPGPHEVLVRVAASEINAVDVFVATGAYRTPVPLPFVVGRDAVGEVVAAGPGVPEGRGGRPGVGDLVWTNSLGHDGRQGAHAEFVVVPADRVYRLPTGADPLDAAALVHTGATAAVGLFQRAGVGVGDTVYIGGGAGGVGSAAVRLAVDAGARVIASASRRDADWVTDLGAAACLDYRAPDLDARIADAAPEGVDVFWDTSGHHGIAAALGVTARRGRVVVTAGLTTEHTLAAGALYTRGITVHGFALSDLTSDELARAARAVNRLIERRQPVRRREVIGLDDVPRGFTQMADHDISGRLVVAVSA